MIITSSIIPIFAIVRKDIGVWLRQPTAIAATVLPAIAVMIILYFGAQAVGRKPVALVVQDNGPHAHELVKILSQSDAFKIVMTSSTPEKADKALKQLKVAAVITIPNNFDEDYNAKKSDPITIHINNLNLDFTNDLRRSLPAAITEFYADKTGSNANTSPIQIHIKETDMRTQDIDLMRFELVPNLVLLLTTAGIVNAGLATAREWEDHTIKELLLAPISRTILIAAVVLLIGAASGYLRPENPIYWISTLVIILLIALASACLGVAIGAAARRFQRVTAIGIPLSIDLFFLSGGITVAAFLPG